MRHISEIFIVLLIVSTISAVDKKTIAVLDLDAEGVSPQEAIYLTNRIRHELIQTGKYDVLERSAMEEILTEQSFQMTGCTSSECAVEAGQLLGVQNMVAGSVGKIGSMYTIFLRLIDVESGEIKASATADCRGSIEDVATNTTKDAVIKLLGGQGAGSTQITKSEPSSGSGSFTGETKAGPLPGMTFVTIPSGSFQMGSHDVGSSEKPIHTVNVKSFQMMTTEVTQGMWKSVMGNNPSQFKGDNLPVETVCWNECQEFIRKLNQRDPGKGYRLPTESEWEYACRAGSTTEYHSGDTKSDLDRVGWYDGNSGNKTHAVGQKMANNWGLYDMHGNVFEWCADWYHDSYIGAPTDGSSWTSPSGTFRVMRGGTWNFLASFCRSANRSMGFPSLPGHIIGFRIVLSP